MMIDCYEVSVRIESKWFRIVVLIGRKLNLIAVVFFDRGFFYQFIVFVFIQVVEEDFGMAIGKDFGEKDFIAVGKHLMIDACSTDDIDVILFQG